MKLRGRPRRSVILPVDNSLPLLTYSISALSANLREEDEVVIVLDGCRNASTLQFVNSLATDDRRVRVIALEDKVGYAAANNVAIQNARGSAFVLMNSDVFVTQGCIDQLESTLMERDAGAVQALLVYPQTGRVQSTGHAFSGDYQSAQLYAHRRVTDSPVTKQSSRQSLTTALCLVTRDAYEMAGGFDEYYYNSHEGMELTLRISLSGQECVYEPRALAYHCSGAARDVVPFDKSIQKARFYSTWQPKLEADLPNYWAEWWTGGSGPYQAINLSTSHKWSEWLTGLGIEADQAPPLPERFQRRVNLYYALPKHVHQSSRPLLFTCDSMSQLFGNQHWILTRASNRDFVMDIDGNVLPLADLT